MFNSFRKSRLIFGALMVLTLLAFATLPACDDDFTEGAYKTLLVSQQTYDSTMTIAADLYSNGLISDNVKTMIIEVGGKYKDAHNTAVQALITYNKTKNETDKTTYETSIASALEFLEYITDMVAKYESDSGL